MSRSLTERLDDFLTEAPKADAKKGGAKHKAADADLELDVELDVTLSMKEMSKLLRRIPQVINVKDARGRPFTYRLNLKYGGKAVADG